jgi:excisionase family DNA binding protein
VQVSTEEKSMEQTLYRISSVMKKLDVCRATVYRMAARGELEIVKIGQRATRVTAESIDRAISAGKQQR